MYNRMFGIILQNSLVAEMIKDKRNGTNIAR